MEVQMTKKKKPKKVNKPKTYQEEVFQNEESFRIMLKNIRPDIFVLMDLIDNTGLNPYIVFHIMKHLNNIAIGTKYGSVLVSIENGVVTFVRGEESTKLNERLKKVDKSSRNS
jgi:hypothetical protein